MNPTCAEHEELLRISQERVKRLEEALRAARMTLLDYRCCAVCAHTYAQHSGHTYSPPYPEPRHCSRGDDCWFFVDGMLHPVLTVIDAALRPEGT